MADTTYADALARLRAECGEPTYSGNGLATWLPTGVDGIGIVLSVDGASLWLSASVGPDRTDTRGWTLDGEAVDACPLTPLADAVRDAGAWLRGRG